MNPASDHSFRDSFRDGFQDCFRNRWEARLIFVALSFILLFASGGGQLNILITRLPIAVLLIYGLATYTLERQLKSKTQFKALFFFQLQSFSIKNPHILKTLLASTLGTALCLWILITSKSNGLPLFNSLLRSLNPALVLLLIAFGIPGFMLLWSAYLSKNWGKNTSPILGWVLMSTSTTSLGLGLCTAVLIRLNHFLLERYGYANLLLGSLLQFLFLAFFTLAFSESLRI